MTNRATINDAEATGDGGRQSSRLATAAQVAAVIGIVICVAIIVGTWLGRGALAAAVDDLSSTVNGGFDRAIAATGQVAGRLDSAASQAGALATSATAIAASGAPPPEALAGLADKVGRLADGYRTIRTRYADLRENVTSALTAVQRVTRFVPGVQAPEGAGDRLQAVDAKLQSIDDTLTGIFPSLETGQGGAPVAAAVAAQATRLQAALADASTAVAGLSARVQTAGNQATNAMDAIRTIISVAAVAITLLFLWVLALNGALFVLARRLKRDRVRGDAASPSALTTARPADQSAS
jgi:hypothetical protein